MMPEKPQNLELSDTYYALVQYLQYTELKNPQKEME